MKVRVKIPHATAQEYITFLESEVKRLEQALNAADSSREELEESLQAISDAWSDAVQSDLEHGAIFLNVAAAKRFKQNYPAVFAMGEIINKHTGEGNER